MPLFTMNHRICGELDGLLAVLLLSRQGNNLFVAVNPK